MWFARIRRFFARHRLVYWSLVAAGAIGIGATFAVQSRQLADARASWGDTTTVWVAAADTSAGAELHVRARRLPVAMLPDDAIRGSWPDGAVARQTVAAGEVIVDHDLSLARLALLPDGWRGVALAVDDTSAPVVIGDRVDVVAMGAVLAADGVVVQTTDAAVVVGVPPDVAAVVAAAALDRTATLTVRAG